ADALVALDNRYDEALPMALELASSYPRNGYFSSLVGSIYARMEEWESAIASYKRALEVDPDQIWAMYNLGWAYIKHEEPGEALSYFEVFIKEKPEYGDGFASLGVAYYHLRKYEQAKASLSQALQIDSKSALARRFLAYISYAEGDYEKAKEELGGFSQLGVELAPEYRERGAKVVRILKDSPASRSGLKLHDVIVECNGQSFDELDDLVRKIRSFAVGEEIQLAILRKGARQVIRATLALDPELSKVLSIQ
ncbi:MAG: tetratricopeptide repeat protein, partial [Candidatus Tectomicrobia bacterium]|nr:tetratricopeptide repeat protein [Candidatus Tectomicrobia bacterium]